MPSKKTTDRRRLVKLADASAALAAPVLVQPSFVAVLDTARRVIATELGFMERSQGGEPMTLAQAKKLQALVQSLATAQTIERAAKDEDLSGISEAELESRLESAIRAMRDA